MCLVLWRREQSRSLPLTTDPEQHPEQEPAAAQDAGWRGPPVTKGNVGAEVWAPFPPPGPGKKASTETNKMAKAFGLVGEEMAFSVFLQLPGWRKSKQSKRKLLLCSSPQESCRLGPERELPAQRGSCDRAAARGAGAEGAWTQPAACPRCS